MAVVSEQMMTGLTIGQLAQQVEVNLQTIRYYERTGLLKPSSRSDSGYRLYGGNEVQRLAFIKRAQALGFTLREIRELLELRVHDKNDCDKVRRKAQAKLAQVETKARHLMSLAKTLRTLIGSCESRRPTEHCPILASLDDEKSTKRRSVSHTRRS